MSGPYDQCPLPLMLNTGRNMYIRREWVAPLILGEWMNYYYYSPLVSAHPTSGGRKEFRKSAVLGGFSPKVWFSRLPETLTSYYLSTTVISSL